MAQKSIDTGKVETETPATLDAEDSISSKAVTREEHVELKEKFYNEAIKALDYRKTIIDSLLAIISLMLVLIGAITAYNYVRGKDVRKEVEKEIDKLKEMGVSASMIHRDMESQHDTMGKMLKSVEFQASSVIEEARAEAGKLGVTKFAEMIKQIEEIDAEQSVSKFELLEAELIKNEMPLSILPTQLLSNITLNYIRGKNYHRAIQTAMNLLAKDPKNVDVNTMIGYSYSKIAKHELALKYFREALEISPEHKFAMDHFLYSALKEYARTKQVGLLQETKHIISLIQKSAPEDSYAFYNLACVYSYENKKAEMLVELQKAIEKDEGHRAGARSDKDFQVFWKDKDFIELTKDQ